MESYGRQLQRLYRQWNYVFENGNEEDFEVPDGYCLNSIREVILQKKKEIEENLAPEGFPEEFHWSVPESVSVSFMACPDKIRREAVSLLESLKHTAQWRWIQEHNLFLSERAKKKSGLLQLQIYFTQLQEAIEQEDFLSMRRLAALRADEQIRQCQTYLQKELQRRTAKHGIVQDEKKDVTLIPVQMTIYDLAS